MVSLDQDQWQMITTTYNGTTLITYKDGTEVNRTNSADISSGSKSSNCIGSRDGCGGKNYDGNLDEVQTYDRALNASEVEKLYFKGTGGTFRATYNRTVQIPKNEAPELLSLTAKNADPSGDIWINLTTTRGDSKLIHTSKSNLGQDFNLGFNNTGGNATIEINMTSTLPIASPDITLSLETREAFGSKISVSTKEEWENGQFNFTTVRRQDDSGNLGLGHNDTTLDTAPSAYWRMDRAIDGNGGTVKDYSQNNKGGTATNGVVSNRPGTFSTHALDFDG
ncbi:MAG: LamG-like jellyroll fold domain-containing protein, partial [Candidatus Nanohaloarchaea archaeon]|nr:LamG-like jellyroll fold domain-containing protein [Candidatus Nanohaloarchaea archaeon]